jgi:hypothetical protein
MVSRNKASKWLNRIREDTFYESIYGNGKHYQLHTTNHIIDVYAASPPVLEQVR